MLADDHILVRWGLHNLLEGYSGFSTTDIGTTNVETNDHAHTVFFQPGESYTLSSFDSTEDDEVIAHALQEELRQECVGKTQDCSSWARPISDIRSNGAVAQHDSYYQKSNCDCNSGDDGDDERFLGCLDDSSDYDGEIGKRITHIDFTPHIPKTNGEIPMDEDACARMIESLMGYTFSKMKVEGDGNCQGLGVKLFLLQTTLSFVPSQTNSIDHQHIIRLSEIMLSCSCVLIQCIMKDMCNEDVWQVGRSCHSSSSRRLYLEFRLSFNSK